MEIREGYKQTEIGALPIDWNIRNMQRDSSLKARIGWQGLTTAEYLDIGDYYLVTGTDFFDGKIKWETCHYVSEIRYSQDRNIQLQKDDIIVTKDGTIGKVAYIDKLPLPATLNSGVFVIRPVNEAYYPHFLFYIFHSIYFDDFLNQLVAGSTISHLYQKDFVKFNFPLPPTKAEQTAIAKALSDADALITSLEKLIEKKQAIKQGAMQQLLKPKEGWVVKKMGGLISLIIDNRGKTPPLANEGFPLIEVNAIYKQGKSPNYSLVSKYVDQQTYINWFRDGHPEKEDILVVTVGSAGVTSFINEEIGCIAQNIIALRIIKEISSEYVYYFTLTRSFSDQVTSVLMGAVQPSLKVPHLKEFEIFLPSTIEEQRDLAQIFSDMDTEILALEQKCSKYKLIKQGMMQELLTGKTRLI